MPTRFLKSHRIYGICIIYTFDNWSWSLYRQTVDAENWENGGRKGGEGGEGGEAARGARGLLVGRRGWGVWP